MWQRHTTLTLTIILIFTLKLTLTLTLTLILILILVFLANDACGKVAKGYTPESGQKPKTVGEAGGGGVRTAEQGWS